MKLADLLFGTDPNCIVCGIDILPSEFGMCRNCLEAFPFAEQSLDRKAIAVCRYEGVAKQLIYDYKYNESRVIGKYMANMMAHRIREMNITYDVVLTVPCSKHRKKVRGFDHALYMAQVLSDNLSIDISEGTLERVKETRRLKGLTKQERLTELENAFEVCNGEAFYGKRLLIIDDILTTGATLSACTQVVIPFQPSCVHWLTFAAVI